MNQIQPTTQNYQVITPDLYGKFIDFVDAKPQTVRTYKSNLKGFSSWLECEDIQRPTRQDVLKYRDFLKSKYKPATVQLYMTALRLFFQWLEVEGLYPDITKHVKGARVETGHKKDAFTPQQIKKIIGSIDRSTTAGKRDYAIFLLMVTGGLRDIEVSRANIGDLRTLGNETVLYIQGKGRDEKSDYIKVPFEVETALIEYLQTRSDRSDDAPLFTSLSNNSTEKRLSTRSISGNIKACFVKAGYDSNRLTAHSLRHTAVTLSLIGGATLQEAQAFARHSSITTTQIYAHNLDRMKNPCEGLITGAIFS